MKIILHFSDLKSVTVFTLVVSAVLSLASCCFIPLNATSKKPCNCGPGKNDIVSVSPIHKDTSAVAEVTGGQVTAISPGTNTNAQSLSFLPGAVIDNSLDEDVSLFTGTHQYSSNPFPVTMTSVPDVHYDQQQQWHSKAEKKLPMGIKKINSHFVAGPDISFKSSKEDYGSIQHKHKPGIGFQAGFRSDYFFSEKFAVTAGLLFKQNNASEELSYDSPGEPGGGNYNENFTTKYQYNYLSVPLLAMFNVTENLSVSAGPELNYLVASSMKTNDGDKESLTKNSTRFGVGMQAAIKYKFTGVPIAVELLYDHRISRLNKKTTAYSPGSSYDSPAWNMKGIQLNIVCALCELMKKR